MDLKAMRFTIRHPRGEGVWADGGDSIGLPDWFRVVARDFLDARACRCEAMGLDPAKVEPLVPAWGGKYYSEAGWRGVRVKAYKSAGVSCNFRELRPGHAMLLKRKGVSIEAVSKRLRHASTVVTEAFYARIEDDVADEACLEVLKIAPAAIKANFNPK